MDHPSLPVVEPTRASVYDLAAVDGVRRAMRIEPGLVRGVLKAYLKNGLPTDAALRGLPEADRDAFAARIDFDPLQLARRFDSRLDGATKLVFRTRKGFAVESVLLRAGTGRVALCVSSQVGCAARCDFCATGRMGMSHSLGPAELLDQLAQANRVLAPEGRRVRNLVFMGMGEPLHNEDALHAALATLLSAEGFHHPPTRVLVSTVGVPDAMLRLAERFPLVNQALSRHAATQATREQLIPLARTAPLTLLRETITRLNRIQPERTAVMLEHVMLAGVNDAPSDAAELARFCEGLRVHVNLIPFNRVDGADHLVPSDRPTIEAFGRTLKEAGLPTTIRYSMGADIDAACGQLVRRENRDVAARLAAGRRAGAASDG